MSSHRGFQSQSRSCTKLPVLACYLNPLCDFISLQSLKSNLKTHLFRTAFTRDRLWGCRLVSEAVMGVWVSIDCVCGFVRVFHCLCGCVWHWLLLLSFCAQLCIMVAVNCFVLDICDHVHVFDLCHCIYRCITLFAKLTEPSITVVSRFRRAFNFFPHQGPLHSDPCLSGFKPRSTHEEVCSA